MLLILLISGSRMQQFWKLSGIDPSSKPVPETILRKAWSRYLANKGVGIDDPEAPTPGTFATHKIFLKWFFAQLHSGESSIRDEPGSSIPHEQFVAWWTEFLKGHSDTGAFSDQRQTLEDFLNWFFSELKNKLAPSKGVSTVGEGKPTSWKDNPFIPPGKKLWLEFLETTWNQTDDELENRTFADFLAEKGITFPQEPMPANMSHDEFLQWWFPNLNSGILSAGPISATSLKKSAGIPHDQFISWWKQFLQDQGSSDSFGNEQQIQEDFVNWFLAEMKDRLSMLGSQEAKRQHIPHEEFLDLMCESLLTETNGPQFPDANKSAPVPEPIQEVERVGARAIDTAARAAERVLRSVPLIDG